MARNQADKGGGIWLKTLLFGVLAMGGIAAAVIILQPMLVAPSSDVALIKAEPGPFREKPKDPGGAKISHTDSTLMGMLGGGGDQEEDVEILQPPADVPEMPPLPETADENIVMAPAPAPVEPADASEIVIGTATKADNMTATASPAPDTASADVETVEEAAAGSEADSDASGIASGEGDNITATATTAPVDTDEAPPVSPQTVPQSKPDVPARARGPKVEGDVPLYLVQLAAFRNADTAREQAAMLGGKHESRLGVVELGTMKVDAGENGVFWRVVTEPLERASADTLCAALKRAGQDCILRKFDSRSS
jgi:cell division septation protein DedD